MELYLKSPYLIVLSKQLVEEMGISHGDTVSFLVTRNKDGNVVAIWVGKEGIFSPQLIYSYVVKRSFNCGMFGFSAKSFVYDVDLPPDTYQVTPHPYYCKTTGMDWWEIRITDRHKKNWKIIGSKTTKKRRKDLEIDDESDIFEP